MSVVPPPISTMTAPFWRSSWSENGEAARQRFEDQAVYLDARHFDDVDQTVDERVGTGYEMRLYLHLLAVHTHGMPDARFTVQRVADGVGMDNRPARHVDGLAQLLGRARHVVCGNDAFPVLDFQPFMTVLEPNVRSRDAHERGLHLVTRLILDGLDGHANRARGGRLVLGVSDDRTPQGLDPAQLDALANLVTEICSDSIKPPLDFGIFRCRPRNRGAVVRWS